MIKAVEKQEFFQILATLDATYVPFPEISDWSRDGVREAQWSARSNALKDFRAKASEETWTRGVDVAMRVAAVDTGALEGLYNTDYGFTFSVATQSIALNSQEKEHYEEIKGYFEAQFTGYKLTLDAITKKTEVTEAWIRALHEVLTAAQDTYKVITPLGEDARKLPRGVYKTEPNHVLDRDGKPFAYAPVLQVRPEMERLIRNLHSDEFQAMHPAAQAAYAHYAFIKIHPFADGNGRVARALTSYYLMKSDSIPFLVLLENRDAYINALQGADKGNYKPLNEFVSNRGTTAMQIVEEFANVAVHQDAGTSLHNISQLYLARPGLHYTQIDELGTRLFEEAKLALAQEAKAAISSPVRYEITVSHTRSSAPDGYRSTLKPGPILNFAISTSAPAQASLSLNFTLFVTKGEAQPDGDFILVGSGSAQGISTYVEDVKNPSRSGISAELKLRLKGWAMGVVRVALEDLQRNATTSIQASGYL